MVTSNQSLLHPIAGRANPFQSLPWSGLPILDASCVQAVYGNLLLLTNDGALHGLDCDTGERILLSTVALPELANLDDNAYFGNETIRLHASSDGAFAAIVVDQGQFGLVVEVRTGRVTMQLNGGDYCQNTVPFSACFLKFEGRNVFVHRTAWNRLDAADAATGASLTARDIGPDEQGGEIAHDLDYFHGQLRPSPDGSRVFDDGWVWQPVAVPRTWSVTDWLGSNPWESEDGKSLVDLPMRDNWTTPACWVGDRHIATWGIADWDAEEFEEVRQGPGIRIFDATTEKQSPAGRWPMALDAANIQDLFSDGQLVIVAASTGTTIWDIKSRSQVADLPGFTARLHDGKRGTLIAFGPDAIVQVSLASLIA